jgi:hypothetical protein
VGGSVCPQVVVAVESKRSRMNFILIQDCAMPLRDFSLAKEELLS